MLKEQNSKSKERLRLEEQRAKYEQKLREQIKKDEKRQRERERALKLLIGELFVKHLPDYMLYEEAELERIVAAAMESEDCRSMIELIRAEAEGATATTEPQSLKDKQKAKEITEPEDIVNEGDETDADYPVAEEDSREYEVNEESEEDEDSSDESDDEDGEE